MLPVLYGATREVGLCWITEYCMAQICRNRKKASTNDIEERKGKIEGIELREIGRATQH